jgi:cyclophilin family peptidyl-prolyl cis-trans isomerase
MQVILKTSAGNITLELDAETAPITVKNFVQYAKDGHYEGTVFHRVIKSFMIQGGGFTSDMVQKKTRAGIKNESFNGLGNLKYTVAMARTNIPDSATSQFFINTKDNFGLDKKICTDGFGYCVFGRVVDGFDIVDKIEGVATKRFGSHSDVPIEAVEIMSVEVPPEA